MEDASAGGEETEASAGYCPPNAASTQRVKSIIPPREGFPTRLMEVPNAFVKFRGRLFFAAKFDDGHRVLWKSDGTSAGTVVVKNFPATEGSGTPPLRQLASSSSQLFFLAADATHGEELWVSNGTSSGTRLLKELTPGVGGSSLDHLTVLGERLVFFRELLTPDTGSTRLEVWTSEGTPEGTVRLRNFPPEMTVHFETLKLGGALLFFTRDALGSAMWRTDGTKAGTVRLKKLGPEGSGVSDTRLSGGLGFFSVRAADGKTTVWKTDGTHDGTQRLRTYDSALSTHLLGVLGSQLYLTATSLATQSMAVMRIPVAGGASTSVVTLPNDSASEGAAFPFVSEVSGVAGGGKLYFIVTIGSSGPAPRDTQLWVTNGTASGTKLLRRPLSLSDEYGSPVLAVADDLAFFSAYEEPGAGIEPWVTNGTPGGTRRLKDIDPGLDSSYPREFFRVGDRVFFSAVDDTHGGQLWSTRLRGTCVAPALPLGTPSP